MPKLFTKIVYSTRPINLFLIFFTYFILNLVQLKLIESPEGISSSILPTKNYLIYTLAMVLIGYGGYLINDLFDTNTDKINKPESMIFTSNRAIWVGIFVYIFISAITLLLTAGISMLLTEINLILIILLFLYSLYFKKVPFFGNLLVGLICAYVPFSVLIIQQPEYESWSGWKNFSSLIYFYSAFTFFTTLMREIIKDAEDVEGDRQSGIKTLPLRVGFSVTNTFVILLNVILILVLGVFLYQLPAYNLSPVVKIALCLLLLIPNLPIAIYTASAKEKKDYSRISSYLKFYMLIGLLSLILFIL